MASLGTILTDNNGNLGRTQADMEMGWTEGFLCSHYSREVFFTVQVIATTGPAYRPRAEQVLETWLGSNGTAFSSKCS